MAQQALRKEQAWQKIADKLGPLMLGHDVIAKGGGSGSSFGQSDYIVPDYEDHDYQDRAYEKAPLLSADIKPEGFHSKFDSNQKSKNNYQTLSNNNQPISSKIVDSLDSLRPSQSPNFSEKPSESIGIIINYPDKRQRQQSRYTCIPQQRYDRESFKNARRRCWTVSGVLVFLVLVLFTLVILMALGVIHYKTFPRFQ